MKMEYLYGRIPNPWYNQFITQVICLTPEFFNHYNKKIRIDRKNICEYCKKESFTHMHHIISLSNYGLHKNINLIELCPECHKRVEEEIYEIKNKGKYNYRLIKKERKLLLKFYKLYINKELIGNHNPDKNFINLHLEVNDTIRFFIKMKKFDELNEYTKLKNISI